MNSVRQNIGGLGNLLFKQAYLLGQYLDGNIPDVYVQSEKYWKTHAEWIKKAFGDNIGYTDKIAIHIRRGDYLKAQDFHVNLWDTDYYKEAIKLFPRGPFLVFCKDNQDPEQDKRDREWCETNLPILLGDAFEMAPKDSTEVEDLNLMASCKSIIMANSSFSWWAAYLNPNKDKVVVCPKTWFTDGVQRCDLLDSWILL